MRSRQISSLVGISLFFATSLGCNPIPPTKHPATFTSTTSPAERITRDYDIRDFIIAVSDYFEEPDLFSPRPAGPNWKPGSNNDLFGGDPPAKELPGPTKVELQAELVRYIKSNITPTAWPNGSTIGELPGKLIVTAPADTHSALAAFFTEARKRRSVQVALEIRLLNKFPFDHLGPELGKKIQLWESPVSPPVAVELTNAECDLIRRAVEPTIRSTSVMGPRITLFSGQHAYILVAQQKAYVARYTPKRLGGFDPQTNLLESGILISVGAGVSEDHKQVAIDLHLQMAELNGIAKVPFSGAPAADKLMIDLPDVQVRELRAIVSVADGRTVLLRGLRDVSQQLGWNAAATRPTTRRDVSLNENVIVLLKATVIDEK